MSPMPRESKRLGREALVLTLAAIIVVLAASPIGVRGATQTGSVSGRVYGFTCHDNVVPLTGATVAATLVETGYTHQPATTAPDSSYNLTLPPGEYTLFVTAAFFQTQGSYSFTVASGTVLPEFNFYLYPVTPVYCPAVMYKENIYTLAIYSNASASKVVFDPTGRLVNFTITITNGSFSGFLIIIPRILLVGTPIVFVDDVEIKSTVIEGAKYYFVQFQQSLGSHTVTVRGYGAISEFPRGYLLTSTAFCLVLAVLVVADFKSKPRKGPRH